MSPVMVVAVAIVVFLAGACQRGGSVEQHEATPAGGAAVGPGLTVEEAAASDLDEPLLVTGYLHSEDGEELRLCAALAESFPPQCADPSLRVEGAAIDDFSPLRAGDTAWTEEPVDVLGRKSGDVLEVGTTSSG